jgi:hypothetical protein
MLRFSQVLFEQLPLAINDIDVMCSSDRVAMMSSYWIKAKVLACLDKGRGGETGGQSQEGLEVVTKMIQEEKNKADALGAAEQMLEGWATSEMITDYGVLDVEDEWFEEVRMGQGGARSEELSDELNLVARPKGDTSPQP